MKQQTITALKITIAAIAAISLAELLHLDFSISAGIVAILSVAPTKKETLKTASSRFYAFLVALLLAWGCFSLVGYGLSGFFLYLLLFLLCCQWRGWQSAMAMNSVLISHFLTYQSMNPWTVANEVALFVLGAGCGIIVNLHLRANLFFMQRMEEETDRQIKSILSGVSKLLTDHTMDDYIDESFYTMRLSIQKASAIANENFMNQLRSKETKVSRDMQYIAMREQQTIILYNIYKRIRRLHTTPVTTKYIADFLQYLADGYRKDSPIDEAMEEFNRIRHILEESPLPVTREEFEARAELYAVLGCIREFMLMKDAFLHEVAKSHASPS